MYFPKIFSIPEKYLKLRCSQLAISAHLIVSPSLYSIQSYFHPQPNKGLNQLLCKTQILGEAGSGQAAAEPRPQIFFPKKRFSITHTSDKQRGKYICNYQKIFAPLVYVTAATSPVCLAIISLCLPEQVCFPYFICFHVHFPVVYHSG